MLLQILSQNDIIINIMKSNFSEIPSVHSSVEMPSLIEMKMPPEEAIAIIDLLEKEGLSPVLDGGWAVDAVAGEQTRIHQDIDFLVDINSGDSLRTLFESKGFVSHPEETEMPHRLVVVNVPQKLMIDFHLVTFNEDGSATFKITNYKENVPSYEYTYSGEGISGVGAIKGRTVRCITLEEQVKCRTTRKYSFNDPDRMRPDGVNADKHDLEVIKGLAAAAVNLWGE